MQRITLLLFAFIFTQTAFSQNCPSNLDFEMGDFTNWECFTGSTSVVNSQNIITLTNSNGPVANRHEIISAATTVPLDPYGKFPKLCPYGGAYSVKLGNDGTGSQAEGLSYTFTVPSAIDTFTFTYFYAVVFQDPSHLIYQQPRFFVTAYEVATGNLINCASFDYVSNGTIPGFEDATVGVDVLYKKWTPASLQFAGLAGRSVRLEFRTADCTLGGHFGYAYLDVGSGCSNILATAPYCVETNSLILNAPYGFASYTWYNSNFSAVVGTQQTLTLSPPPATAGTFFVDVIPYPGYGCRDTLQAIVTPLPVPDTPVAQSSYSFCQFQATSSLTATATQGHDILWYTSAAGGIGSTIAPRPPTGTPGTFTYYVSQKKLFGCESFRKAIMVYVIATPVTSFTTNTLRQCQNGNNYTFTSTTTNRSSDCVFTWDFGDGQTISSAADSVAQHVYTAAGTFTVKLRATNGGTCFSEKTVAVIVVPKPVASFTYPAIICEKQTPINIINTSSVPNGVAVINKWWWNINGVIEQTRNPAALPINTPGPVPVKLVVTTTEGCVSDTNTTIINVRFRPTAALTYSKPLCDNEIIQLTDVSTMPQAAMGETIVKWYWQFDNSRTSSQQNPVTTFIPGLHHAKLISESNFGCKSLETDSVFDIHAKPQINLAINDSCVFRTINYQALDVAGTVDKWFWNFGNGLQRNNPVVSNLYRTEGYRPLTLLGQTIYGCKDTLIRPFRIYDNKAFAGRDTVAAWDEPVQLNANGGANVSYSWTPAFGLNNSAIENPIALYNKDQVYQMDAITDKGCDAHSKILIRRYKGPELYIPSAFTPNGDGKNDVLYVFPVGIKTFTHLTVYNRYGQRIFYTTNYNKGWDGKINGNLQEAGAYIAISEAIDYKGRKMMNKITVMLIR